MAGQRHLSAVGNAHKSTAAAETLDLRFRSITFDVFEGKRSLPDAAAPAAAERPRLEIQQDVQKREIHVTPTGWQGRSALANAARYSRGAGMQAKRRTVEILQIAFRYLL